MRETPDFAKQKFLYRLSRSEYEKEWGKDYVKPGMGTRILSTLLRYMPKIGPFKGWDSIARLRKPRTCTSRASILRSINTELLLEEVGADKLVLPDYDLDSGNPTVIGEYSLADQTYSQVAGSIGEEQVRPHDAIPTENNPKNSRKRLFILTQ